MKHLCHSLWRHQHPLPQAQLQVHSAAICSPHISSHLLTTGIYWNIIYIYIYHGISVARYMMTIDDMFWHIKTPPSSPQRPIRFPNCSKFPGTWSRQMAPSRSPLNASRCNMFKHYSWNTHGSGSVYYVLDKGHSLQKFLNRFKSFEMFPHCPVRLFAGISFDLAFSCNQKVSKNSVAQNRLNRLNRYPLDVHLPSFGAFWLAAPWGFCQQWTSQPFHGTSAIAATSAWALLHDPTAAQQLLKCLNCPPAIKDFKLHWGILRV